jgi:CubicO group peptidase (beta-lactamase class C family)
MYLGNIAHEASEVQRVLPRNFQYNNLMYYTTAYLVERIADQRWEDFVHERIFPPLGMVGSNFAPEPPQPGQVGAKGYRVDHDEEGGAKGLVLMPFGQHTELSPGAAGALFSTMADLIQWLKVHVNAGRAVDIQLVSPGNLQQMHLLQTVIPGGGFNEALLGNTISPMGWAGLSNPIGDIRWFIMEEMSRGTVLSSALSRKKKSASLR